MRLDGLATMSLALLLALAMAGGAFAQSMEGDRTTVLVGDDGGDVPSPQHDVVAVTVFEDPRSTHLLVNVTMGSVSTLAPGYEVDLFLTSLGEDHRWAFTPDSTGMGSCPEDVSCYVDEEANVLGFEVPFEVLGDPEAGDELLGIWVATYQGVIVDRAPGEGAGAANFLEGAEDASYEVLGPANATGDATDDPAGNLTGDLNATADDDGAGASAQGAGDAGVPGFAAWTMLAAALVAASALGRFRR